MAWDAGDIADTGLFWNPGAISYLAESLLAGLLAIYLSARAIQQARQGRLQAPTPMLAVLMSALVLEFLSTMFRVQTAAGWPNAALDH